MVIFNCGKLKLGLLYIILFVFFVVFAFSINSGWSDYSTPSMPQFTMPEIKMPNNNNNNNIPAMPTFTFPNPFPVTNFPPMPSTAIFTNTVNFPTNITNFSTMPTYTFPIMPQLNIVFPEDVKLRLDRTFGPLSYTLFSSSPAVSYTSNSSPSETYYISSYSAALHSSMWSYLRQKGITVTSNIPLESKIPGSVLYRDLTTSELKRMEEKWKNTETK